MAENQGFRVLHSGSADSVYPNAYDLHLVDGYLKVLDEEGETIAIHIPGAWSGADKIGELKT